MISLVDPLKDLPRIAVKGHPAEPVTSVAFSPDGSTIAEAIGRKVVILDSAMASRGRLWETTRVRSPSSDSPDGWKPARRRGRPARDCLEPSRSGKSRRQKAHGGARPIPTSFSRRTISPDGQTLATAGYDRLVILWDLATLKPVRTLKDHTDSVYALAFAPRGKTLASAARIEP